jgi:pimeloyl-ACP methyl ester carboxylesterase
MWDTFVHRWLRVPYALHVHTDKQPTKKPRATVLFLHGIGNSGDAWKTIIQDLPDDIRVVVIDLLGFGKSPSPSWAVYNAKTQAKSVAATFLKLGITQPTIIVGHSLGALVAVEAAKRYPFAVRSLILCSPPFYKESEQQRRLIPQYDSFLKQIYSLAKKHPNEFVAISQLAVRLGLVNKSYNVTHETTPIYMNALTASIINQTTLYDAVRLTTPTRILYGRFDPMIIFSNLRWLAKNNPHVTLKAILAGHEMFGSYVSAIRKEIAEASQT